MKTHWEKEGWYGMELSYHGETVGLCLFSSLAPVQKIAKLEYLYLEEKYRGEFLSYPLFLQACMKAEEKGCQGIYARVDDSSFDLSKVGYYLIYLGMHISIDDGAFYLYDLDSILKSKAFTSQSAKNIAQANIKKISKDNMAEFNDAIRCLNKKDYNINPETVDSDIFRF